MPAFFLSDIHLHPTRQKTVDQLKFVLQHIEDMGRFVKERQLFLLGDIFDAWIGDDDKEPLWQEIKDRLKKLTTTGCPVYWIAGNRDFLVGNTFMHETGCKVLSEPASVMLPGGHSVVLLHGDLLCTRDLRYQRFRRFVRHPFTVGLYRRLPLVVRLTVADYLRRLSRFSQQQKKIPLSLKTPNKLCQFERGDRAIEWIDESMSDALLQQHHAHTLIHGHIHREGIHERILTDAQGHTRKAQRIVLGDWDNGPSVLVFEEGQFYFKAF
ncbi:MAG: hypothetical protein RLZ35_918 [Pseudomonadota bacterium]|jgi:UDP-2,3-diacylglucosamine hydrolase